jgi:catechol 2,3-dioxygenase-like lactoylglutathione lyase family enzyme
MTLQWTGVCIDCADGRELADFYARLLGWEITAEGGDWFQLTDPDGGVHLNIQGEEWYAPPAWPERPGAQTKMLHFEILVDDLEAAIAHAVGAGARVAEHQPSDRDQTGLRVLLDPAGHPFCLFTAGS